MSRLQADKIAAREALGQKRPELRGLEDARGERWARALGTHH